MLGFKKICVVFICCVFVFNIAGCATMEEHKGAATGAGVGAAAGAGLGFLFGGKEGALIGAAAGAALGGLIGSYQDKKLKDRKQTISENPNIDTSKVIVRMNSVNVKPTSGNAFLQKFVKSEEQKHDNQIYGGDKIDLVLDYTLTAPGEGTTIELQDIRSLSKTTLKGENKVIFESPRTYTSDQGTFESTLQFTIPKEAQEGNYNYKTTLKLEDQQYSKDVTFHIASAPVESKPDNAPEKTSYYLGEGRYLIVEIS